MFVYPDMTKSNTALLVIDPINSCVHEQCEIPKWGIHFSKIRHLLPKLAAFIPRYRQDFGGRVIFTTTTPWTNEYLPANLNRLYQDPQACYYSNDTTGFAQQFHTLQPGSKDLVFSKNTYDIFSNPDFVHKLAEEGIAHLLVTGVFTDGCVLASVIGGFSRGFNFTILKDLVETTDDPLRQQLQKLLLQFTFPVMYGPTITSKDFLQTCK